MARYTGSVCRICRRENLKLFLKGDRCYSDKCAFDRRGYPPGQHGQRRGRKISDYGIQLREKQKVKRMYGLSEKQFHLFFERAEHQKGITGIPIFWYFWNADLIMLFIDWALLTLDLKVAILSGIITFCLTAKKLIFHRILLKSGMLLKFEKKAVRFRLWKVHLMLWYEEVFRSGSI